MSRHMLIAIEEGKFSQRGFITAQNSQGQVKISHHIKPKIETLNSNVLLTRFMIILINFKKRIRFQVKEREKKKRLFEGLHHSHS